MPCHQQEGHGLDNTMQGVRVMFPHGLPSEYLLEDNINEQFTEVSVSEILQSHDLPELGYEYNSSNQNVTCILYKVDTPDPGYKLLLAIDKLLSVNLTCWWQRLRQKLRIVLSLRDSVRLRKRELFCVERLKRETEIYLRTNDHG